MVGPRRGPAGPHRPRRPSPRRPAAPPRPRRRPRRRRRALPGPGARGARLRQEVRLPLRGGRALRRHRLGPDRLPRRRGAGPGAGARASAMPSRYSSDAQPRGRPRPGRARSASLPGDPHRADARRLPRPARARSQGQPLGDLAEQNVQARIRGQILMALSNDTGGLVLSTGNKSELAVGYCTLYGDMAGGLAVIGDLPKTHGLPGGARRQRPGRARAHPGADLHEAALGRAQAGPGGPGLAAALRRARRHPARLPRGAARRRARSWRAATRPRRCGGCSAW